MSVPILATKLFIPSLPPNVVLRQNLTKQLNEGLQQKLTLVSASAGFGKTTLLCEWVTCCALKTAWLSLDESDSDLSCFLIYLIASLQTIEPSIGVGLLDSLQSSQPPLVESVLTVLINEITTISDNFILVLDDYHLVDSEDVDNALTFFLEHLPKQLHLVIATREDPLLPLARLRAKGQLNELRVSNLRFSTPETADFLNRRKGLKLSEEDINALEIRTEGWISGLQLAAISMEGHSDISGFIKSFTGSHHFVLDYLIEEVLQQQTKFVQTFLLKTSILDRMCGDLCDALLPVSSTSGQKTLEYLQQANLFIIPLDFERKWFRYHHLFSDLLRRKLQESSTLSGEVEVKDIEELHSRASQWYENNNLDIEAFYHAAAANDVKRAERLIEGNGMPLQYRGAMIPVMKWLESLPKTVLDDRPSLWVIYASALTMAGKPVIGIEHKLQSAEALLLKGEQDNKTRDLIGHIASIRAMLAIPQNQVETMILQSQRALEFLSPNNLPVITAANWTLGYAYQLQGDFVLATKAYNETILKSRASGNIMIHLAAVTCLGQIQQSENNFKMAVQTYEKAIKLTDDPPWPASCAAYLGLAQIYFEWNDLDAAEKFVKISLKLAVQLENVSTPADCKILLEHIRLSRNDLIKSKHSNSLTDPLSRREMEVLKLIAEGFPNREIGEKLFIALDTVKGHNRRIFGKLNVENRAQAIIKAQFLNILPL